MMDENKEDNTKSDDSTSSDDQNKAQQLNISGNAEIHFPAIIERNTSKDSKIETRKLSLIRKPRGSQSSRHTLYTITSCSEAESSANSSVRMSDGDGRNMTEGDDTNSSVEYPKFDVFSKPTNFATIHSSRYNMLPRISLTSGKLRDDQKRRMLRSRSSNFPDIEMRFLAKKNWINAEVKTFPIWHDLNKGTTTLRNSLPSLEMIEIEKMLEEMRHTKQTNPSALQFDVFAKKLKKENDEKFAKHLMSNPRYNTMLEFENY